jgi:hypothetical protein
MALDLIRDTRQAYANVLLAQERLRIAEDAVQIRQGIAEKAQARLQAGDVSVQEAATAGIDARAAHQDVVRLQFDVKLAEERLRNLLAIGADRTPLVLNHEMRASLVTLDVNGLAEEAVVSVDALAAEQNAAAAEGDCDYPRSAGSVLGILDATSGRIPATSSVRLSGPRCRSSVNQGDRVPKRSWNGPRACETVGNQIRLDVHQAHCGTSKRAVNRSSAATSAPGGEAAIRRAEAAIARRHALRRRSADDDSPR